MVIPRDTDATAGDVVARRIEATPVRRLGRRTRTACEPLRTVPVHSVEALREPRKRRVTFAVPEPVDTYDTRMMSPALSMRCRWGYCSSTVTKHRIIVHNFGDLTSRRCA